MKERKSRKTAVTVFLMMAATVLSKLLGMLRSVLLASHYGTGSEAAAFSAASRIPLSFFDMLFSAAIVGCFIPIYNSFSSDREKEASEFANIFLDFVMLVTGVLSLLGIIFADQIIALFNTGSLGLDAQTQRLAARLLRMMFPMVIFTGGAYTLVGILQSKNRFLLPAFISSVSNLGVILYFLFLDDALGENGIYGLAAAYALSWLLQFVTLALPLLRSGAKYRLVLDFKNPALKTAIKTALPVMAGSWLAPAGVLCGTFFSSYAAENGNVIFDYANNVYTIIAGTLTYSICNYIFPSLSRMAGERDDEGFSRTVGTGFCSAMAIILPFMFATIALCGEGVCMLYMRNEFSPDAARATAATLAKIAVAMPSFAVIEIFSRVFFAKKQPKIPMIAAAAGIAANIACSILTVGLGSLGIAAVGISNAAGQITAAVVLLIFAAVRERKIFSRDFFASMIKIFAISAVCAAIFFAIDRVFAIDPFSSGFAANLIHCVVVFVPGAAAYVILLKLTKVRFSRQGEVKS